MENSKGKKYNSNASYLGSDPQSVLAGTYGALTITGSGTKTLAGAITAASLAISGSNSENIVTLNGASNTVTVPAANVSAQWATLNNVSFTNAVTIDSYDNIAGTNTVVASGTTNVTVALTAASIAANTPIVYGAQLDSLVLTATYNIQGNVVTDTNGTLYGVIKTSNTAVKNAAVHTESLVVYNSETATKHYSLANGTALITYTVDPRVLTLTGTTAVNNKSYDGDTTGTFASKKRLERTYKIFATRSE